MDEMEVREMEKAERLRLAMELHEIEEMRASGKLRMGEAQEYRLVAVLGFYSVDEDGIRRPDFHAFNEALLESGIAQEYKDVMMGHKRGGARESYPIKAIVEAYQKAFPLLSINQWRKSSTEFQDLKRLVNELIKIQLSPNPFLETVKLVERLQGLKPNELVDAIQEGRMSKEALLERIKDLLP